MDIQTQTQQNTQILQLTGELDAGSIHDVEQHYPKDFWSSDHPVVIDLSCVNFIDSSGVGMLVFLVKRLWSMQRKVALAGLTGQPARLITMLRIEQSIPCYDSVQSCLHASEEATAYAGVGRS